MSLNQLFDQFIGGQQNANPQNGAGGQGGSAEGVAGQIGDLMNKIPGGAAGGLAAGGLLGVLLGSKKARKTVGKVAGGAVTLGGAALLGAAAYTAYNNWKSGGTPSGNAPDPNNPSPSSPTQAMPEPQAIAQAGFDPTQAVGADGQPFQMALIKAMIAAANADGHIDQDEQTKIFEAVNRLELEATDKALVFDTLQNPPSAAFIAALANGMEQASEIYMASRLAIDPDNPQEHAYLTNLVSMLSLPDDLVIHLEDQLRTQMMG